jgi:hypothetical protein
VGVDSCERTTVPNAVVPRHLTTAEIWYNSTMKNDRVRRALELHAEGKTWHEVAPLIGMKHGDSVRKLVRQARRAGEINTVADKVKTRVENGRLAAQLRSEQAILRKLTERRVFIEEVRGVIRDAAKTLQPIEPPAWIPHPPPPEEEVGALVLADGHLGMSTPGRINAGWSQTVAVTEQQMRRLTQEVLRYWERHRWRELVMLDLGDDVEGSNMRPSQHRIVDPLAAQQSAQFGRLLAECIANLLSTIKHMRLERVPGNHGRPTEKAGNAGLDVLGPENSWDWVAGEFVREIHSEAIAQGRLEVHNHQTWYGITEILGHRVIFEHGSSLRGGGGNGGLPFAQISRMALNYLDLEGMYTLLALGHWHRPYRIPNGYAGAVIGTGAFPPTTPFVVSSKHQATRPSQTLLSINRKQGISAEYLIYLDTERDRRP